MRNIQYLTKKLKTAIGRIFKKTFTQLNSAFGANFVKTKLFNQVKQFTRLYFLKYVISLSLSYEY